MSAGRRGFLLASAGALTLALAPRPAHAAEVKVIAELGSAQVQPGEAVYLQIQVSSEDGRIGTPAFPGLRDVDVEYRGVSQGSSVNFSLNSNGRQVRERRINKTFTYVIAARKAGRHPIPIEVEVGGKTHRPARKLALDATGSDPADAPAVVGLAGDAPQSAEASVIVWPVVGRAEVYVGQQVLYELRIYDRSRGSLSIATAPTFKDFWSEELEAQGRNPRSPSRTTVDGVPYRLYTTIRRALFPQKAGTLTIGGPAVELQQSTGLFFGGPAPTPKRFVGRKLAVEVKPLPAAGQPAGFPANNVGRFSLRAEVDRSELRQGEAVRLTLTIAGEGNIALVGLPELPALPGLRSYEPKPQTPRLDDTGPVLRGSREYTLLLVAEQAGALEIPSLELPYFDPERGRYAVARSEAIALTVEEDPDAVAASSDPAATEPDAQPEASGELLADPLAGDSLARTTPREVWLDDRRWWISSLAAPAVLGLGWLAGVLARRLGPDDAARARARAQAERRELLNRAGETVSSGEGFYPALAALLQSAALARAGSAGVGLTRDRLVELLSERGVDERQLASLRELLDACDAARFGAGSGDAEQRRAHLERTRELLRGRAWRVA